MLRPCRRGNLFGKSTRSRGARSLDPPHLRKPYGETFYDGNNGATFSGPQKVSPYAWAVAEGARCRRGNLCKGCHVAAIAATGKPMPTGKPFSKGFPVALVRKRFPRTCRVTGKPFLRKRATKKRFPRRAENGAAKGFLVEPAPATSLAGKPFPKGFPVALVNQGEKRLPRGSDVATGKPFCIVETWKPFVQSGRRGNLSERFPRRPDSGCSQKRFPRDLYGRKKKRLPRRCRRKKVSPPGLQPDGETFFVRPTGKPFANL